MPIGQIANGETGSSVRDKLNEDISLSTSIVNKRAAVFDSFNRADGTSIGNSDSGVAWTTNLWGTGTKRILENSLRIDASGEGINQSIVSLSNDNRGYTIYGEFQKGLSTNVSQGIIVGILKDANNYIGVRFRLLTTEIIVNIAGTTTVLANQTLSGGTDEQRGRSALGSKFEISIGVRGVTGQNGFISVNQPNVLTSTLSADISTQIASTFPTDADLSDLFIRNNTTSQSFRLNSIAIATT